LLGRGSRSWFSFIFGKLDWWLDNRRG